VLPFSAVDYSMNTQSGQDLEKMCLAGVDEIVLMGYWDDWGKSTTWLAESIAMAREKVEGEARLSVLLDADMSRRATAATLAAIDGEETECGWFLYDQWTRGRLDLLHRAKRGRSSMDAAQTSHTTVTIRIDTEPDYEKNYDEVDPDMITKLLDLFREEGIHATFVTCARLAEQQTDVLRQAEREGHEIAVHAYDHEQIDALSEEEQIAVIDRATDVMRGLGFHPTGFGAPRNSITDAARDRLIERGYFYDGSAAFDPLETYLEPFLDLHDSGDGRAIVVVPFVIPNDWDARFLNGLDPAATLTEWSKRLEKMASEKQPCFVLDIHQWSASRDEDLEVLRQFIRIAKSRPDCRFATLHEAAEHALAYLREGEAPALRP
jgi:peptidoglycan/xylan/chitin deacetylase (PgdA/CDA1 family)